MKNNSTLSRFELEIDGKIAFANYRIEGNVINIDYVFSPEELRKTGAAGKLMAEIVEFAQKENKKITPICAYAAAWMRKHKEFHNLLSN